MSSEYLIPPRHNSIVTHNGTVGTFAHKCKRKLHHSNKRKWNRVPTWYIFGLGYWRRWEKKCHRNRCLSISMINGNIETLSWQIQLATIRTFGPRAHHLLWNFRFATFHGKQAVVWRSPAYEYHGYYTSLPHRHSPTWSRLRYYLVEWHSGGTHQVRGRMAFRLRRRHCSLEGPWRWQSVQRAGMVWSPWWISCKNTPSLTFQLGKLKILPPTHQLASLAVYPCEASTLPNFNPSGDAQIITHSVRTKYYNNKTLSDV